MPHRVIELHCIMPIANVPSVMQHGILSHERAARLDHQSVAMAEIQDRRDHVHVPGGLRLHQYANLYFNARNPMMFKRKDQSDSLCVLRVSRDVLGLERVVLADQNASSDYVRFLGPAQLRFIQFDLVYADDWRHPGDQIAYFRHKAAMCAEVLVPGVVPPELIAGAYVVNQNAAQTLAATGFNRAVNINTHLFFR
jgi:hypothetical protein